MNCSDICIDVPDYDEGNVFYREAFHIARKSYRCCECHDPIEIGMTYQYTAGKSEGKLWTMKTCAVCCDIRRALICGSWVFGELWDEIYDYIFPAWEKFSPIDCIAKIESLRARSVILTKYSEWQHSKFLKKR